MGRASGYWRQPRIVKPRQGRGDGPADHVMVKVGPDGRAAFFLLTTYRSTAEVTRRLRHVCRLVLETPSFRLGEGGR